jgi:hypothetical protein
MSPTPRPAPASADLTPARRLRRAARFAAGVGLAAAALAICPGASEGPDVIVGSLFDLAHYTSGAPIDGLRAYAVGTRSLNIGDADLRWVAGNNQHPVIGTNMYRLKVDAERPGGRFEQVGMSWLKHGFTALAETQFCGGNCTFEPGHGSGSWLGMGCADPYWATLNGSQSGLGPRSEVNAATGFYPYDGSHPTGTGHSTLRKRLLVADTDLDPALNAGARYFVEGQYVTSDDALSGNGLNNASYREITVSASRDVSYVPDAQNRCPWDTSGAGEPTFCAQPALFAWREADLSVEIAALDVPADGRFYVARKVHELGGGSWRYEYAIHNLNSDRSAGGFAVDFADGTTISGEGFADADYHSGEPYSGTDWTAAVDAAGGAVAWSTDLHSVDPNANALRWATLDNFWFDATAQPDAITHHTLTLFKPGTPCRVPFSYSPTYVFSDDFETGDSCTWSSVN